MNLEKIRYYGYSEKEYYALSIKEHNRLESEAREKRLLENKPSDWYCMPAIVRWLAGKRIGYISNLLNPGYGACKDCHTTWYFVEPHSVMTSMSGGYFDQCEKCWRETNPNGKEEEERRWKEIVEREGPTYGQR